MTSETYISIPRQQLKKFSQITQRELQDFLFGEFVSTREGVTASEMKKAQPNAYGEIAADISSPMLTEFMKNVSNKTRNALRVIAQNNENFFHLKDVVDAIDEADSHMDTRGIWAGITKRTRTITGDKKAMFVTWGEWIEDEDGNNIDCIGEISEITHASLKAYFG